MLKLKFKDFKINLLLESVLDASDDFIEILKSMNTSSKIEDLILGWIETQSDINTNVNSFDVGDENDKIKHFQDRQYQRFKQSGDDISKRTKLQANIGSLIRGILDQNQSSFNPEQIEEFVTAYKSQWNKKYKSSEFSIVSGRDINFWYNENNYVRGGLSHLGSSCMRQPHKNHRMNFYSDNPDKVSMVILTDYSDGGVEKLLARALVWKLDDGRNYIDRIYFNSDDIFLNVEDWVKKNFPGSLFHSKLMGSDSPDLKNITISLKKTNYQEYPYMDSFVYLVQKLESHQIVEGSGVLTSYQPKQKSDQLVLKLRNQISGVPEILFDYTYLEEYGWYTQNEITPCLTPDGTDRAPRDLCDWSKLYNFHILKKYAIWSKFQNSLVLSTEAKEIEPYGLVDPAYINFEILLYIGEDDYLYPWEKYKHFISDNYSSFFEIDVLDPKNKDQYRDIRTTDFGYDLNSNSPLLKNPSGVHHFLKSKQDNLRPYLISCCVSNKSLNIFSIPLVKVNLSKVYQKLQRQRRRLGPNIEFSHIQSLCHTESGTILKIDAKLYDIEDCIDQSNDYNCGILESWRFSLKYHDLESLENRIKLSSKITPEEKKWRQSLLDFHKEILPDLRGGSIRYIRNSHKLTGDLNRILSAIDNFNLEFNDLWTKKFDSSETLSKIRKNYESLIGGRDEVSFLKIFKLYTFLFCICGSSRDSRDYIQGSLHSYYDLMKEEIPIIKNFSGHGKNYQSYPELEWFLEDFRKIWTDIMPLTSPENWNCATELGNIAGDHNDVLVFFPFIFFKI